MAKCKIPARYRDLRRYILRKDILRTVLYVLWIAAWFCGVYFYNQSHQTYPPERLILGWKLAVWMLASLISGFFLFRIRRVLFDRTFSGEIVRSHLSHTYTASDDPGAVRSMSYDFRLKKAIRVRKSNGRIARLKFEEKNGSYLYYGDGAEIVHFHGFSYPINVDPTAPHGYVCIACGRIHEQWQEKCEICELSLIDPKELEIVE
ncbi:MAG: hypothetical protein IJW92_01440 [Clostridia bacterium]|nr:hypothetical protein [Clostridia bacterium]